MGSLDCVFSSDDIVVKPLNDKRLYRTIELHNGLCALLVHDPEIYPAGPPCHSNSEEEEDEDDDDEEHEEDADVDEEDEDNGEIQPTGKGTCSQTKKAAAAMCVGMGNFSDPLEAQGLAHFLGEAPRKKEKDRKQKPDKDHGVIQESNEDERQNVTAVIDLQKMKKKGKPLARY